MCGRTDFPGVVTTVLDGFNAGATEKSHSTPSNLETPSLNASFPDTIASDLLTSVYPICDEFQDFRASFSVKDNLKSDEAPTAQGQSCVIEPRDDPSCKLFVGQVPRTWKEATLRSIFSTCGMVTDVQIMRDARGGSNGCAWVTYHSQKEAETAIRLIHGHEIQCDTNARENKILQVRFATPKHPHHPKPEEKVKPSTFGWEKTLQQHYTAGIGNKQYENSLTAPVHIHTSAIPSITHVPVSDSSAQWITLASLPQSYALQPNTTLPPANNTFSVLQPNFASSNGMVQQVSFVGSNPQYMTPYASLIPVPVQAPTTLLHSSNSPNGVAVSCVCSPVSTLSNPTQIASPLNSRPMPFQGTYSTPNPIMSHWTPAPASVLNQQNILQPISQTEHPMMISTYIVPVTNCGPVPGIDPTNAITKAQLGCTLRGEPFDANDKNQHQIFVTRLISKADEGHLRRVLERYGPIAKVKFLEDGVAVSYHTRDAAERTLLDPHLVQEWCLKAEIETQQDECKLFIGMIPFTVCEESLRKLFEQFGTVLEVHIIRAEQGESRGAAFVRFQNPESAARAKQQLHGSNILTTSCFQHPMTVQIAKVTKKSRRRQKRNKLKHKESVKIIDALYSSEISTTGCSVDEELDASDSNSVSVTQRPLEKGVHSKLVKKGTAKGAASTELDCKSCKATIISDPPHCGPEGANLFIRNLSRDTNEDNLRTLFEPFGTLLSATVFRDVRTGRSRGFGFVSFSSVEEAVKAIAQLHGFMMNGRALQVEPKKQNTTRSDTDRGVADEVPNDLATIPPLIHPRDT